MFEEALPYYISIGMSPEQFWEGDPDLCIYYRKADELRLERENMKLWLQGHYIYEALCDVAPIYHTFAKRGTKPVPYPKEPYTITRRMAKEREESHDKAVALKGKNMFEKFMRQQKEQKNGNS